jgi:predicted MFS family arabinose efflux permease
VWATVPEPRTRAKGAPRPKAESFRRAGAALSGSRVFTGVTLAAALMTVLAAGQGAFLGSLLIRLHGLDVGQAGIALGLTLGGGGMVGSLLGGFLVDRYAAKDLRRHMTAPIVAVVLGSLFFVAAILQTSASATLALLIPASILTQCWFGPAFSAIQRVTPPQRRATAAAIHAFMVNLIGVGLGPFLVGLLSDGLNHGMKIGTLETAPLGPAEGLRNALLALGLMPTLAAFAFLRARRGIVHEVLPER